MLMSVWCEWDLKKRSPWELPWAIRLKTAPCLTYDEVGHTPGNYAACSSYCIWGTEVFRRPIPLHSGLLFERACQSLLSLWGSLSHPGIRISDGRRTLDQAITYQETSNQNDQEGVRIGWMALLKNLEIVWKFMVSIIMTLKPLEVNKRTALSMIHKKSHTVIHTRWQVSGRFREEQGQNESSVTLPIAIWACETTEYSCAHAFRDKILLTKTGNIVHGNKSNCWFDLSKRLPYLRFHPLYHRTEKLVRLSKVTKFSLTPPWSLPFKFRVIY